jgi:hypothetical protein
MKKYKILLIMLVSIILTIYGLRNIWKESTYQEVLSMYPLEKSTNKEASAQFLKAMEYRIYIKQLHPFFDYDSFVMAPLLKKLDYHFQKGKKLLPKNSVEDIVWWTLFYKEIYSLLGNPRNDLSLAYENLPYDEFRIKHDMIYEMIMRYPEGEVYFNIDEIEKFRFQTMAILSGFYYKIFSQRYNSNSLVGKSKLEQNDINAMKLLSEVKEKYKVAYKKFIDTSKKKEFIKREYLYDMVSINTKLIVNYVVINKTQQLPRTICYSEDNKKIVTEYVDELLNYVENSKTSQSKVFYNSLFNYKAQTNVPTVFKMLNYRCPNLRPKISEIVQKIDKINNK